jgi:hypothetical protein
MKRSLRRLLAIVIVVLLAFFLSKAISHRPPATTKPAAFIAATGPRPVKVGVIDSPALNGCSGLAASRRQEGVIWTFTDLKGANSVYAITPIGHVLGTFRVTGSKNVNWEDIAADGQGNIYIADTGNNDKSHKVLTIYRIAEPAAPSGSGSVTLTGSWRFRYPTYTSFDCEAVFVWNDWAYLIAKEPLFAKLFRIPLQPGTDVITAQYLGTLPVVGWITGSSLSADGRRLALISYSAVSIFDLPRPIDQMVHAPATTSPADWGDMQAWDVKPRVIYPKDYRIAMRQAEGITWLPPAGGAGEESVLLISNEQRDLYRLDLSVTQPASGAATRQ